MKTVIKYVKPYRLTAVIALFLTLVELAVELSQPIFMSKIVDDGILQKDLSTVLFWGGMLIAISFIALLAGIINSFFAGHTSQSTGYDLREALFEKVQSFSFSNFQQFPTSSLMTRMTNDVTQIQNTIFMLLRIMSKAPLIVIGSIAMIAIINIKLGMFLLIGSPLLIVFLMWMMGKVGRMFQTVQKKLDQVNNVVQENLTGIRLIKAFVRRKHEAKRFTKDSAELRDWAMRALRFIELAAPTIFLVMNGSIIAVLWFGNLEVETGGATVGEVVAIVNYTMRMTHAMTLFSMLLMFFSRSRASANRIAEVLLTDAHLSDTEEAKAKNKITDGKITFDSVSFHYPNTEVPVLSNVSFEVQPGERVAILGATGSGKSSLFQLIPRLYDVDNGAIYIDDMNIREMTLHHLRRQIGFVPQEVMLFSGTVRENILWGKEDATMEEIIVACKHAQIHETIEKLPQGYETKLGQKGVNLSGGQKQRLSIARALVRKPKILLLDDSTSALDVKTERQLLDALKNYDCTLLMITQKLSTTMNADKILLFEDGKLIAEGTHEELLKTSSLYYKIFESQFGKGAGAS